MNEDQKEQLEREAAMSQMGQQVLNNEAFKTAITVRKAQIFDVFCNTSKDQGEVREEAWRTMVNITALEGYFEELLTTGKMAETTLKSTKED